MQYIIFNVENGIAWVQFNRPDQLNALNEGVFRDLKTAIEKCESDDSIRVVILKGNQRAFVAGSDIKYLSKSNINMAYKFSNQAKHVQERLFDLAKPTIAAVSGFALGGGLEMALCCDFRIAAENAVFGIPEIGLGIIPGGGGTQRLPRLIGLGAATELLFLGKPIKADKAKKIGLVNKVVPLVELENEVKALASDLMSQSAIALRSAKIALHNGLDVDLKNGLQIEQDVFCMLFGTEDQREGMAAFIEKRRPVFKGK